jgi:SAM-dependent methyltransferase
VTASEPGRNYDRSVVDGFGDEWRRFNQRGLADDEARQLFERYFAIFPWEELPPDAAGFDAGCGSGRWARFVAPRVGTLHCVDASTAALTVAQDSLAPFTNCRFHLATVDSMPLADGAADFGYSLGVLHHIPDTRSALRACAAKLKPGAPFLLYLYYAFDNRPAWFRMIWKASDLARSLLARSPFRIRAAICDLLALTVYWPLARAARLIERTGAAVDNVPLAAYRHQSLYVMRTDALDRFGTRLEKRFTRDQMRQMMEEEGLTSVRFHSGPPWWVAVGTRTPLRAGADRPSGKGDRLPAGLGAGHA